LRCRPWPTPLVPSLRHCRQSGGEIAMEECEARSSYRWVPVATKNAWCWQTSSDKNKTLPGGHAAVTTRILTFPEKNDAAGGPRLASVRLTFSPRKAPSGRREQARTFPQNPPTFSRQSQARRSQWFDYAGAFTKHLPQGLLHPFGCVFRREVFPPGFPMWAPDVGTRGH
jgi:hypothetical protein